MVELTQTQKDILKAEGHLLVSGGPGSGKTVSQFKAARLSAALRPAQSILFLSFARATVARILEAIDEEKEISKEERSRIDVDTYHAFFWRVLKTHGYLVGLPRRISLVTPPNEAIALVVNTAKIQGGCEAIRRGARQETPSRGQRANSACRRRAPLLRSLVLDACRPSHQQAERLTHRPAAVAHRDDLLADRHAHPVALGE